MFIFIISLPLKGSCNFFFSMLRHTIHNNIHYLPFVFKMRWYIILYVQNKSPRTFHRCFIPSLGSFGPEVSEEKILKKLTNQKQKLPVVAIFVSESWQNVQSLYYRGPSIDASYQVSVHLAKRFQRRRIFKNWPIRNKNCLWWPCLLMDRD